ncbi:MAG TPA: hypothetical protein VIG74_06830 [Alphaproteobacteria bacterium]|jgi:hypothetical protein
MESNYIDMEEMFSRAREAFYAAYLVQTEHTLEERLRPQEMLENVRTHVDDFMTRLVDAMAEIKNVPAQPVCVFMSYETADDMLTGIFAAASMVEQDLREECAPDEFIERCQAVTFDLADYLLKRMPS